MFGNKENKPARTQDAGMGSINIIGAGTEITGDVTSMGDIRIDGNIKGKIISKAKVVIGPQSIVTGDIEAQNADISGKVNGKIAVSETLFLKQTALIYGDITINKLVVESGAEYNGTCTMLGTKRPAISHTNGQQDAKPNPKTEKTEAAAG